MLRRAEIDALFRRHLRAASCIMVHMTVKYLERQHPSALAQTVAANVRAECARQGLECNRRLGVTRQAAQMTWGCAVEELEHAETRAMSRELVG